MKQTIIILIITIFFCFELSVFSQEKPFDWKKEGIAASTIGDKRFFKTQTGDFSVAFSATKYSTDKLYQKYRKEHPKAALAGTLTGDNLELINSVFAGFYTKVLLGQYIEDFKFMWVKNPRHFYIDIDGARMRVNRADLVRDCPQLVEKFDKLAPVRLKLTASLRFEYGSGLIEFEPTIIERSGVANDLTIPKAKKWSELFDRKEEHINSSGNRKYDEEVYFPNYFKAQQSNRKMYELSDYVDVKNISITDIEYPLKEMRAIYDEYQKCQNSKPNILSLSDAQGKEGQKLTFTASLTRAINSDAVVDLSYVDKTATGSSKDGDYNNSRVKAITIPKGKKEIRFEIETYKDDKAEKQEEFEIKAVSIRADTNNIELGNSAIGKIINSAPLWAPKIVMKEISPSYYTYNVMNGDETLMTFNSLLFRYHPEILNNKYLAFMKSPFKSKEEQRAFYIAESGETSDPAFFNIMKLYDLKTGEVVMEGAHQFWYFKDDNEILKIDFSFFIYNKRKENIPF